MNENASKTQIRINLSYQLYTYLKEKSQEYGLTMSAYVKNLIIQDLKDAQRPIYQAPLPIDQSVRPKKRYSLKGITLIDG